MEPRDVEDEATPLLTSELMASTQVWPIIHEIKEDVMHYIDTPLSWDALTAPDSTYTVVRPLNEKYKAKNNLSVTFCFLLNRVHFLRDQNITTAPLSQTRAALCEILAIRSLRDHADSTLALATACTTAWPIFAGAPAELREFADKAGDEFDIRERVGNAIEMAIVGNAKRFIKSSACQSVIDGIYWGRIVYQASADHSILADTYKLKPIHFYDPHRAPLLDHYRLKVPVIRSVLEYINFLILFILFVLALEMNEKSTINTFEGIFMIYGLGFVVEKLAAMQEHGIRVYSANLWNGFDIAFITVYISYASLRLYGVNQDETWAQNWGIDILAVVAVIVFPRLAFVTLSNNLMVLSLRSMFIEFAVLMFVAAFCFGGFLYALWTLGRDTFSSSQIAWWMLDLWFGLDASGFDQATTFHPQFGPVLMILYACLSNTLLLTVLVSILSTTFSNISNDAAMEAMFRRAVSTIEGVKADAIFSYQPPLNLVALLIMFPSSFILSPRWFHKVNVTMIRITGFPILLAIGFYERQKAKAESESVFEKITTAAERFTTLPRRLKRMTLFEGAVGSSGNVQAIFELDDEFVPSPALADSMEWPSPTKPNTERERLRPMVPRLDTIMSTGSDRNTSERGMGTSPGRRNDTPPDAPSRTTHAGRQSRDTPPNGNQRAANDRNQRPQLHGQSAASTHLNVIPASPLIRRSRRKSTFEPRTLATDAPISPAVPSFTSPLAQLFSPIVSEAPDGGFTGPGSIQAGLAPTHLGLRRASRRSANESQLAPGVALFRRKAKNGMLGPSGLGTSALSTTPREEPQEPLETAGEMQDDEETDMPEQTKMAVMEQRLQRIEDLLQQLMDRLDG
ncbi:hypothetical protein FRC12_004220 [Ceratobasidium sp. 428]|nr:hypothetical protein FRC09_003097 [Ceratobasidium sp. 395]KAG8770499.1 hypothetical protein FRC12_004220 [Ceratobasidium sp. 428]